MNGTAYSDTIKRHRDECSSTSLFLSNFRFYFSGDNVADWGWWDWTCI